jgi:hypothetical protein
MFYYATAETISEAENAAPWAADIVEVEGGYLAFESAAEARKWIDQQ